MILRRNSSRSTIRQMGRFVCFLFLGLTGCSHLEPYYRGDVVSSENTPSDEQIAARVLLVGDAGQLQLDDEAIGLMTRWAAIIPDRSTIIFLGDNIYPQGLPEPHHPKRIEAEQRLTSQINVILNSKAKGLFIPGNHDWANSKPGGQQAVIRQAQFVNSKLGSKGGTLVQPGCPGPRAVDLDGVRIIAIDTAWWLYPHEKDTTSCAFCEEEAFVEELKRLLFEAGDRRVIVVGHHPMVTYGPYNGFFDWKDHLFPSSNIANWLWIPTPGLGSLYPLLRYHFIHTEQTLSSQPYRHMIELLQSAFSVRRPLIYAAGHEHGLQVIDGGESVKYLLVSALGPGWGSSLSHGSDTRFAHLHHGFMVVDVLDDGRVFLRVVETGEPQIPYTQWLMDSEYH